MGKKRAEKYELKIVLKEGVKFDDLLRVAVKKTAHKKDDSKSPKK